MMINFLREQLQTQYNGNLSGNMEGTMYAICAKLFRMIVTNHVNIWDDFNRYALLFYSKIILV